MRMETIMRLRHLFVLLPLLAVGRAAADPDDYVDVERGKALATAGDCVACHTASGGQPFAGGLALQTPFGAIMTPNLTPDNLTGIGSWSKDDFARAMHEGRRPGGTYLYPAFPYPYYTKVTRGDLDALYAYLRTLPPVENRVNRNTLPFPLNIRPSMLGWNMLFFTPGEFKPENARTSSTAAPIWPEVSAIAAPATRLLIPLARAGTTNFCEATRSTTGPRPISPTTCRRASANGRSPTSCNI
jgi:mono/diheme cytochrome c family protein